MAMLGCLNLRPLKMHFSDFSGERYLADRPCRLGACCCCPLEVCAQAAVGCIVCVTALLRDPASCPLRSLPLQMTLWESQGGRQTRIIGKVTEDFSPYCSK